MLLLLQFTAIVQIVYLNKILTTKLAYILFITIK